MAVRGKVLIVEDDRAICSFMRRVLEANGYESIIVGTGREALSMLTSHCPDVVILDLGLPDMDGMDVLTQLRAWALRPGVVVAARTDEREKVRARDAGADDYITKPFGTSELLARLRTAIRHTRTTSGNASIAKENRFIARGLVIDYDKYRVYIDGRDAGLTQNEFKLVALLGRYAGRVLTYDYLIREIWGPNKAYDNQILRVNMANIRVTGWSPQQAVIAPETAGQRTICFACAPEENVPFTVECEYDSIATYHALDPEKVSPIQPEFDTQEQAPHIRFTPFLRELCRELSAGETNPLKVARRFSDYCTPVVTYSYMREYFTITQNPEYAGLNQKGDCGVQALLFITLCRCAGIPARWQSGLFVTPYSQGCHDWAPFYVAPSGWLFADCSFGGTGYRAGRTLLHEHYFGNLDPYRMAANSQFQWEFDPPTAQLRSDPTDNQRGEAEYEDRGLSYQELDAAWELLEMTPLAE